MANRWQRIEMRMPRAWMDMADQLAMLTDQTRAAYCRDALIRQMMADWETTPGRGFWLRPQQPVYQRTNKGFVVVASTLGGERCWPIENLSYLPKSLGGDLAFRCDIVPVGMKQGLTMSDAVVARSSFGGPAGAGDTT